MADRTSHADWGADYDDELHEHYAGNHAAAFEHGADCTFYPGEPIGGLPRRRAAGTRSKVFIVLALAGCGWGLVKTEPMWRPWMVARLDDMMAEVERQRLAATALSPPADAALPGMQQPAPLEPLATKDIAEVSGTSSELPVATDGDRETAMDAQDTTTSSELSDESETSSGAPEKVEAEPTPLPQPTIDPGDPYQKRALAVGLHPNLRVFCCRACPTPTTATQVLPSVRLLPRPPTPTNSSGRVNALQSLPCSRCISLPVPARIAGDTS